MQMGISEQIFICTNPLEHQIVSYWLMHMRIIVDLLTRFTSEQF